MNDNEIIKLGDVCAYFYDNQNTSFSVVEVVRELSQEVAVVKFHQVLRDDSGNGLFTYLCDKGKTMNVSRKYLHKLDLINRQKAEKDSAWDSLKKRTEENIELQKLCDRQKAENERLLQKLQQAQSEAYREFAERFNDLLKEYAPYDTFHIYEIKDRIDIVEDELTRNLHESYTESNE